MTTEPHLPPVISVMLAVSDATAAAQWYSQALGATELWNLGGVVGLTIAGAPFFLGEPESNGWDTPAALGSRTVRVEVFVEDPDGFIDPFGCGWSATGPRCAHTTCSNAAPCRDGRTGLHRTPPAGPTSKPTSGAVIKS